MSRNCSLSRCQAVLGLRAGYLIGRSLLDFGWSQ